MKLYPVVRLGDNAVEWYQANTAYQAMSQFIYTHNLSHYDPKAKIELAGIGGRTLFVDHNGETWGCMND